MTKRLARTLFAAAGIATAGLGLGQTAYAADPPAGVNWTGFYIGAYAGWGWGTSEATDAGDSGGVPWYAPVGNKFSNHSDGFSGGGQAGYNYQFGPWVAGVEADVGSLGLHGKAVDPTGGYFDTFVRTNASYDATFRGRLGFAAGSGLFYATAGGILADFSSSIKSFSTFHSGTTGPQWGWTVGGGVEYALDPQWSLKGEYLYYDAGTTTVVLNNGPGGNRFPISNTGNLFRIGLNYRFSGP